ncbi:2-succinyl-5-enolpyruvyl-6-hydroxy-3-cyclohexene-1-carboxylic-acid synthase [Angustibacter peucedani]
MNPSTACATVLVDELVRHGVREAVLCPGSRSAPLAFALHAADGAGRLRLHVRTDERAAAFLALGLAKAAGVPVPVVTTSGTAVANLHPAVLEASHAGVPLLLLTADRPPELRGTGANQTTRQVGIFGTATRWDHDLGTPDHRPGQVASWRSTASRAVLAAVGRGGPAGPVHLDLPFREPLVPTDDGDLDEPLDGRPGGAPWTSAPVTGVAAEAIQDDGRRTLVVVGDLPTGPVDHGDAAADLAARHGWPLVAEPSSGGARSRSLPHASLLLGCESWLDAHRPERVVLVGRVTLQRGVARLLAHPGTDVDLVAPAGPWPDPGARVRSVLPLEALDAGRAGAVRAAAPTSWASAWHDAAQSLVEPVGAAVGASWPSGPAAAQRIWGSLPAGAQVFVGSSNPVRDLDVATAGRGPRVLANRGLAGIDGCLSTASGLALATSAPTYALVGDLTFLHDLGGLVVGPHEPRPDLTVVVVNDDGGGIFSTLEPGGDEHAGAFERVFGTPHGADLGSLVRGVAARHVLAETPEALDAAVCVAPQGITVVEVPVDRTGTRALHTSLRDLATATLTS